MSRRHHCFRKRRDDYQFDVEKGPGIKPIRPEFLNATLSELAADDALFFADTGTACIWLARHIVGGRSNSIPAHLRSGLPAEQTVGSAIALPRRRMEGKMRRQADLFSLRGDLSWGFSPLLVETGETRVHEQARRPDGDSQYLAMIGRNTHRPEIRVA
jgi:thiamine pyrophosphate-dependent acetolactate synthase large subunit-like protein